MANILRVFDVSNIIKRGYINKRAILNGGVVRTAKGYKSLTIPSGGISFLFRIIKRYKGDTLVFCCDRSPDFKRDIDPSYKAASGTSFNEDDTRNINKQLELVEIILANCGYTVLSAEHYEADDIIYSLVKEHKDAFDHTYIHTTDSDTQFLVDNNVSIGLVGDAGKEVNMQNYTYTVISNKTTPYNTRLVEKILHGGKDNIKSLSRSTQAKLREYLYINDFSIKNCGNKEFVFKMIENFVPEALKQAQLVFPLDAPINGDIYARPQIDKVNAWGFLVGCSDFPAVKSIDKEVDDLKRSFFEDIS